MNKRRLKGLYAGGQTQGRVKGRRSENNLQQSGGCLLRVASYGDGKDLSSFGLALAVAVAVAVVVACFLCCDWMQLCVCHCLQMHENGRLSCC